MSTVLPSRYIGMTRLRARLTEMIDLTLQGRERVMICRHGKPVVALVTINELHRIWADEEYELYGPINPETGSRHGGAWVKQTGWKRPLFEAEVIAKEAAEKAEVAEMHARIEAKIRSWEEEETEETPEESAQDARPVWWKRWW